MGIACKSQTIKCCIRHITCHHACDADLEKTLNDDESTIACPFAPSFHFFFFHFFLFPFSPELLLGLKGKLKRNMSFQPRSSNKRKRGGKKNLMSSWAFLVYPFWWPEMCSRWCQLMVADSIQGFFCSRKFAEFGKFQ